MYINQQQKMQQTFDLDNEGYIKIDYDNIEANNGNDKIKRKKKFLSWYFSDEVMQYIKKLDSIVNKKIYDKNNEGNTPISINEKNIMEIIGKIDVTTLLRIPFYVVSLQDFFLNKFNIRGVPLKKYLSNDNSSLERNDSQRVEIKLWDHQIRAINFMKNKERVVYERINKSLSTTNDDDESDEWNGIRGGIICMEMGLGKSLVSLVHVLSSPKSETPTLIIASKSVINEWKKSGVEKFFGKKVNVLFFHPDYISSSFIADQSCETIKQYEIVFTTYDICLSAFKKGNYIKDVVEIGHHETSLKNKVIAVHQRSINQVAQDSDIKGFQLLYEVKWHRIICDESQKISNPDCKVYKSILGLYATYKWCLTGTPIRNYDTDIWSQFRFLGYTSVQTKNQWRKCSQRYGFSANGQENLNNYILNITYKDAQIKLPDKCEIIYPIILSPCERNIYNRVITQARTIYNKMINKECAFMCVLAMFARLRLCCIAPYLLTASSKREKLKGKKLKNDQDALNILNSTVFNNDKEMSDLCHTLNSEAGIFSSKITKAIEILKKLTNKENGEGGEKIIAFSSFTSCLDLFGKAVKILLPNVKFIQVDGDTKGKERDILFNKFTNDTSVTLLMLTYKVGSEGLNITEAKHVLLFEPWWNNSTHKQAIARTWRMGQCSEIFVHHLVVNDSIENKILDICREKDKIASNILNGTSFQLNKGKGLDIETLGIILADTSGSGTNIRDNRDNIIHQRKENYGA
jgi:SNF2 family DNA or RNA helicase